MSAKEKKPVWSPCARCGGRRQHDVLFDHERREDEEYQASMSYMVVECRGCTTISFRTEFADFEAGYNDEHGEWQYPTEVASYPRFIEAHHALDGLSHVPKLVRSIYNDTILAIQEDAKILACIGLRGTIEAICIDRKVTARNLEIRISKLASSGLISKSDADRLHGIRFLGNDAAHEIKGAEPGQIEVALKIVEHAINSIYLLDHEADGMLHTAVTAFDRFLSLLAEGIRELEENNERTLAHILGSSYRRVKEHFAEFETQLKADIASGSFSKLELGRLQAVGSPPTNVQLCRRPAKGPTRPAK